MKTIAGVLLAAVTLLVTTVSCAAASTVNGVPKNPRVALPVYGRAATLTGPIAVGHVIDPESGATTGSTASYGYTEEEYFASGTASAFRSTSDPSDGRWNMPRLPLPPIGRGSWSGFPPIRNDSTARWWWSG